MARLIATVTPTRAMMPSPIKTPLEEWADPPAPVSGCPLGITCGTDVLVGVAVLEAVVSRVLNLSWSW